MSTATEPLAVGLIGAGPWAGLVHAPMLAAGPATKLAGVWARRPEAAAKLAERHHVPACHSVPELLERCEAVAFAVPPDVQARLAIDAAAAGKSLLLEKPVAADVDGAERLAEAVESAGVSSLVVLTWRYARLVQDLLAAAPTIEPFGGRGVFVSAALLGGPFATPWRLERGPLLDLGPHVVDLLDAALGPVRAVRAHGDLQRWVGLLLDHEGGAASEVSLCATAPNEPHPGGVEIYGAQGKLAVDCTSAVDAATFATVVRRFAAVVAAGERTHDLDVHRGLHLQRILADAEAQLRTS